MDDLSILARPVLKFTKHWIDWQIRRLAERNVHLTYQLMGSLDSQSEATEGSLQVQAVREVRMDKGKNAQKRPRTAKNKDIQQEIPQEVQQEVQPEEPQQKKARTEREHSPVSSSSVREVEMFPYTTGPLPESVPTPNILSINASQGHHRPRSQRQ